MTHPHEVDSHDLQLKMIAVLDEVLDLLARVTRNRKVAKPVQEPRRLEETQHETQHSVFPSPLTLSLFLQELDLLRRRVEVLEAKMAHGMSFASGSSVSLPGTDTLDQGNGSEHERASTTAVPTTDVPSSSQHIEAKQDEREQGGPVGRLPREISRQRALSAAKRLRKQGRAVTLASVARAAGLKYSQVVYAFKRREGLLADLE